MTSLQTNDAAPRSSPPSSARRPTDRERLELLFEAGRIADAPGDFTTALRALATLLAERFCDLCTVEVLAAHDATTLIAVAHADPQKAAAAEDICRRHPPRADDRGGAANVLRTGRAEIHPELPREPGGSRDADQLRTFRDLGMTSAITAPIRVPVPRTGAGADDAGPGQVLGVITVLAGGARRFDSIDLRLMEEIGVRAGMTVAAAIGEGADRPRSERDKERLLQLGKEARAAAEGAMHRISTLQMVTAALSEAVSLERVAEIIVTEGTGSIGAAAAMLFAYDPDAQRFDLIAQRGLSAEQAEALTRLDTPPEGEGMRAIRACEPIWMMSPAVARATFPDVMDRLNDWVSIGAIAVIPMAIGGHVSGLIALGFHEPRSFPEEERVFALSLARQCAHAMDRARLYEVERRANRRLVALSRAGEVLSSSIDYETTLENVARAALPALGDYAFFDVYETEGARRLARSRDGSAVEAACKTSLGGLHGAVPPAALRWHQEVDEDVLDEVFAPPPEEAAALRALGMRTLVSVPLTARGEVLGTLSLAFGPSGRRHTHGDLPIIEELSRRAAIAVENAALHRDSREATRLAQEANRRSELANRTKDEFLGVVSHELRTPLNAVLGWSQLLRGPSANDPAVLAKGLRVIDKNARAQAKLIEDLLDVSRIITGKLRLELRPIELESVLRASLEVIRPAAEAKGVELCAAIEARPAVMGDPDRLQQVVWNLLSNAVKFTPGGGRVDLVMRRMRGEAVIVVRDSGCGIETDFLPYVFDRFRQADASSTRRYGGLGLGLAIARNLVELHGGSVRAESEGPGRGATFTVRLPTRAEEDEPEPRWMRETDPGAPPSRLDGIRVLVVDDEPDARELIGAMLKQSGAEVLVAGSAAEALSVLERSPVHVLVSDVAMPGEDGHTLIRRVRTSDAPFGRVPALALTAYAGVEDARRAEGAGFQMHMPKPAEPLKLAFAVAVLAGRAVSLDRTGVGVR
jgi:signal transduction histidine kinase/ActR/RegA family two-component response regulator